MENKLAKVSIITLTYKKFERIKETMRSVLSQDYENIEYIICDDGSSNFPRKEIETYLTNHSKDGISYVILHNDQNYGTVKNANRAYKVATGEYFINLSCGDVFYDSGVVSRIVDRFQTTKAQVIVTSRIQYCENFEPICYLPHYFERKKLSKYNTALQQYKAFITSRFFDMASGSAMYYRRDIIEEMGYFDERYTLWEDGPFLSKYLLINKLEQAYDIISIWYESGGVSTGGSQTVNPLYRQDLLTFAFGEKLEHLSLFSHFEKRMINYRNDRMLVHSRLEKIKLYVSYFPQLVIFLLYSFSRSREKIHDKQLLKEIERVTME